VCAIKFESKRRLWSDDVTVIYSRIFITSPFLGRTDSREAVAYFGDDAFESFDANSVRDANANETQVERSCDFVLCPLAVSNPSSTVTHISSFNTWKRLKMIEALWRFIGLQSLTPVSCDSSKPLERFSEKLRAGKERKW